MKNKKYIGIILILMGSLFVVGLSGNAQNGESVIGQLNELFDILSGHNTRISDLEDSSTVLWTSSCSQTNITIIDTNIYPNPDPNNQTMLVNYTYIHTYCFDTIRINTAQNFLSESDNILTVLQSGYYRIDFYLTINLEVEFHEIESLGNSLSNFESYYYLEAEQQLSFIRMTSLNILYDGNPDPPIQFFPLLFSTESSEDNELFIQYIN